MAGGVGARSSGPSPAADATIETAIAATSSSGGSRLGTVRASRVLPEPGGPMSKQAVLAGQGDLEPSSRLGLPADLAQVRCGTIARGLRSPVADRIA